MIFNLQIHSLRVQVIENNRFKVICTVGNVTDFYSINTLSSNSQNNLVVSLSMKIEDQQSLNKIMEILKTEFKDSNITFYNRPES